MGQPGLCGGLSLKKGGESWTRASVPRSGVVKESGSLAPPWPIRRALGGVREPSKAPQDRDHRLQSRGRRSGFPHLDGTRSVTVEYFCWYPCQLALHANTRRG